MIERESRAVDVPQKHCSGCNTDYPATVEYFPIKQDNGHLRLRWLCRTCWDAYQKEYQKARPPRKEKKPLVLRPSKSLVGTPTQCGSCGAENGNILGDVDKSTLETYGYLCMKCRRLVQDSQGDAERMRKAIAYIERTRPKNRG